MTKYDLVIHVNIRILASGDDTSFIYDMQLQTQYKLLSELIRITDSIQKYFHTISLFICVRNSMYCLFIWNVYGIFGYIRYHTWYNELCSYKSICFSTFYCLLICAFVLTLNIIKNIPNVDFMATIMKLATCHVRNAFKRPLRPNAPTVRVLTSVILKGIEWAFRKLYPTKIPGMVHQGLLAPQRLLPLGWGKPAPGVQFLSESQIFSLLANNLQVFTFK